MAAVLPSDLTARWPNDLLDRVGELRFPGGVSEDDIAEAVDISVIAVKRGWKAARAWLMNRLQPGDRTLSP